MRWADDEWVGRDTSEPEMIRMSERSVLSLFDNDPFSRFLERFGLPRKGRQSLPWLAAITVLCGYLVPFALARLEGLLNGPTPRESFLLDANFPIQVLAIIILFVAEGSIDRKVGNAGTLLHRNQIVKDEPALRSAADRLRRMRESRVAEAVIVGVAIAFTSTWVYSGIASGIGTWQFQPGPSGALRPTLAGWWAILVFGPFFQYICVRWVWKYVAWIVFLWRLSRADLRVYIGHPDRAGGLSFLGNLQGWFGIVVFALGLVIGANDYVIYYVRGNTGLQLDMLLSSAGFVIGAPVLFLTPLLFFTRKLASAKEAALLRVHVALARMVAGIEKKYAGAGEQNLDDLIEDFSGFAETQSLYQNLESMRVYPFDLGTVRQLAGAAVAPLLPLLVQFIPWEPIRILVGQYAQ